MKQRIKSIIEGFLLAVLVFSLTSTVLAQAGKIGQETWTVNFNNIKLVIDGVLIEPKDALGNSVDPFIYNGTTYLPVRAVAEAMDKTVSWDGSTSTVYVGGEVDKPAKEVTVFNRSYIENSNATNFRSYEDKGSSYVGFMLYGPDGVQISPNRYTRSEFVVYPLNSAAKTFKGKFLPPENKSSAEAVYKIYDESGNVLYQSPIMLHSTNPIDIEIDVSNCLSLKIEITNVSSDNFLGSNNTLLIENPTIITTDYVE